MQLSLIWQRRLIWLGAALAVAAYFPRFQRGAGSAVFSAAADCMLQGQTPRHCEGLIFTYPPLFALLWTPLAQMPAQLQAVIWYLALIVGVDGPRRHRMCQAEVVGDSDKGDRP